MTPAALADAVLAAIHAAVADGDLPLTGDDVPASVRVDRSKGKEHGDYATSIALVLAKPSGLAPRAVAEALARRLTAVAGIKSVDIAGPGFLNIVLDTAAQGELARSILAAGTSYGTGSALAGTRLNLEFISANPTGPLHLGHARWAALGDALGRVLSAAGAEVSREFYINDRGAQMDRFGESLAARARGEEVPSDGYHGDYIDELAAQIVADDPTVLRLPRAEQGAAFQAAGYALQLAQQQGVLAQLGVAFDVWYSEQSLYDSGAIERSLATLRSQGHVFEADHAIWLRTTDFGDDRDRVLIRSNRETTYFASDSAYYLDKRARGFDVCVYMLGADHHGYVGRLRAIAACAGDNPDEHLVVLVGQLVKILKGGEELRLSKRAGTIVTLEDFVELAGVDAVRYSLSRYPADSSLTLDIDDITRRSNDNPVFYVQYVAARTAAVHRNASELGIERGAPETYRPELLEDEREGELLGVLAEYPRVVATAAELREPHRVARYLEQLAGTYHRFYDGCRILPRGDEVVTDLMRSRLWLNDATRQVIVNGLGLLGVSAPDRM